jgi:hypothetical protein
MTAAISRSSNSITPTSLGTFIFRRRKHWYSSKAISLLPARTAVGTRLLYHDNLARPSSILREISRALPGERQRTQPGCSEMRLNTSGILPRLTSPSQFRTFVRGS